MEAVRKDKILRTYTQAEAERLFHENAVLIGNKDVVPVSKAIRLLGQAAVDFAKNWTEGCGGYGLGTSEPTAIEYFYRAGFNRAVTYYNIKIIQQEEGSCC